VADVTPAGFGNLIVRIDGDFSQTELIMFNYFEPDDNGAANQIAAIS
jgi:hypothetical protein